MINNSNHKDNIFVEIEEMNINNIPKILLIKDNKLITKINTIFREIFDLYSSNGKMSKSLLIQFLEKKRNNDNFINELFLYDINKD